MVRKAITGERFVSWFANLEPYLVAMEACSAAHWPPDCFLALVVRIAAMTSGKMGLHD